MIDHRKRQSDQVNRERRAFIEDNARTKPWRDKVADACRRKLDRYKAAAGQPIGAEITFTLARPKGHYGTGRNAGVLKTSAPAFPISHSTGDVDKLLDALARARDYARAGVFAAAGT